MSKSFDPVNQPITIDDLHKLKSVIDYIIESAKKSETPTTGLCFLDFLNPEKFDSDFNIVIAGDYRIIKGPWFENKNEESPILTMTPTDEYLQKILFGDLKNENGPAPFETDPNPKG